MSFIVFSLGYDFHDANKNCSTSQIVSADLSPNEYVATFCPWVEPESLCNCFRERNNICYLLVLFSNVGYFRLSFNTRAFLLDGFQKT